MSARKAKIERNTNETQLSVELNVDGEGVFTGSIGVPFMEHMLSLLTRQALFNLSIAGKGDLEIDAHHTIEDLGIVLGQTFKDSLGDKLALCVLVKPLYRWKKH